MKRFILILCLCFAGIVSANYPEYPPITAENVANLREVEHWGNGEMNRAVAWSSDGSSLLVGGRYGIFYYENIDAEPEFIELDLDVWSPFFASDSLIFFKHDSQIAAFDLNERRILYEVEGYRPLAISHNGQML